MRPSVLVWLGTNCASIFQYLEAPVNSPSTSCPLGNRPCAPVCQQRLRQLEQTRLAEPAPARVTTSGRSPKFFTKSSIRTAWTVAGHAEGDRRLRAGRRLFCRCSRPDGLSRPGRSASAQAITRPGKPAPEPRSTQHFASGASGRSCSESAMCRVQTDGMVERRDQVGGLRARQQEFDEAIEPRRCFT